MSGARREDKDDDKEDDGQHDARRHGISIDRRDGSWNLTAEFGGGDRFPSRIDRNPQGGSEQGCVLDGKTLSTECNQRSAVLANKDQLLNPTLSVGHLPERDIANRCAGDCLASTKRRDHPGLPFVNKKQGLRKIAAAKP